MSVSDFLSSLPFFGRAFKSAEEAVSVDEATVRAGQFLTDLNVLAELDELLQATTPERLNAMEKTPVYLERLCLLGFRRVCVHVLNHTFEARTIVAEWDDSGKRILSVKLGEAKPGLDVWVQKEAAIALLLEPSREHVLAAIHREELTVPTEVIPVL